MGEELEAPVNGLVFEEPWRVRISTPDGQTLGAGILVSADTVLTCAHVIPWDGGPEPAEEVLAEFVGVPGSVPVRARVAEGCWVSERADATGDVALLTLAEPQEPAHTAPLHRVAPSFGRAVRMCGFPAGWPLSNGLYLAATIAGPSGEWVQLDPVRPEHAVRPGFSGAGVTDMETRHVLGMVVSRYDDTTSGAPGGLKLHLSYMIPIETVAEYLPALKPRFDGPSPNDLPPVRCPLEEPRDREFTRWLTRWFRGASGTRDVEAVVIRKGQPDRAAALSRAVALAGRQLTVEARPRSAPRVPAPRAGTRPPGARLPRTVNGPANGPVNGPVNGHAAEDSVPPIGSVDLALDVSGETVARFAARVADRLGLRAGEGKSAVGLFAGVRTVPLTIVAEGVDYAADPVALVEFTDLLAARGARLLLVFRTPDSQSLELAQRMSDPSKDEITVRLDRVHDRIEHIARLERTAYDKAALVAPVRSVPQEAAGLRLDLTTLRGDPELGSARFLPKLAAFESAVASGLLRVEEAIGGAEAGIARRDELRGRLEAFFALLAARSLEEERAAAPLYRAAHNLLYQAPCELAEAEGAVERFAETVRRHTHRPRGGERA